MRKLILFLPFLFAAVSCKYVEPIEKYNERGFVVAEKDTYYNSVIIKSKDSIKLVHLLEYDIKRLKVGDSLKSK